MSGILNNHTAARADVVGEGSIACATHPVKVASVRFRFVPDSGVFTMRRYRAPEVRYQAGPGEGRVRRGQETKSDAAGHSHYTSQPVAKAVNNVCCCRVQTDQLLS